MNTMTTPTTKTETDAEAKARAAKENARRRWRLCMRTSDDKHLQTILQVASAQRRKNGSFDSFCLEDDWNENLARGGRKPTLDDYDRWS